jgi:anti-sigma-K factor RskA
MNYRDKPDLQEALAAEYVLGTLRGRARARFQSWMEEDGALRLRVTEWQTRLTPMAEAVEEVTPPRRVWKGVSARIAPTAPAVRTGWWDSLAFWRNWGLVTTGCAAALVAGMALREPIVIEREVPGPSASTQGMDPAYVGVVKDARGNVMFVAYARRDSNELWLKGMGMQAPPKPGMDWELWGLPDKPGMPPRSLGLVPSDANGMIKLASAADAVLADYPRFAVSMEPQGGSRTGAPTGPVMYQGECVQFW